MKQWAPTWLKRLGRVWEPFHENFKTIRKRAMSIDLPTVLRPLGLRILSDFRNKTEPRKKVVYQSLPAVLTRSLIHLVPATVSIVLVVVNCNGIFVGRELTGESGRDDVKNAAIQIAAKIQELFILSSLGSIVLHLIRERLLFGEGVALGLLGSDKAFSQVTFFLSTDFWGGFASYFGKGKSSRYWCEGLILGVLLLFGGVLALLAGPSTAVLMQPRSQPWPVGGGMFQLNRTEAVLWPAVLDISYKDPSVCNTPGDQLNNPQCPSAGFRALNRTYNRSFQPVQYQAFEVDDGYLRKTISTEADRSGAYDTWAYTTHGPTADFQDSVIDQHTAALRHLRSLTPYAPLEASPAYLDLAETKVYSVETKLPLVRTTCELQPTMTMKNATTRFKFARFERFGFQRLYNKRGRLQELDVFEDLRRHLSQRNITLQPGQNLIEAMRGLKYVAAPVDLPANLNGSIATVLFRRARNVTDDNLAGLDPFHVTTCTVDARWVQGNSYQQYDNFRGVHVPHVGSRDVTSNTVQAKLGQGSEPEPGLIDSRLESLPEIDRGEIRIYPSWFDAMSPFLDDADLPGFPATRTQPNRTTIERLIQAHYIPNWLGDAGRVKDNNQWRTEVEIVIASLFADALSRCGTDSPWAYKGIELASDHKQGRRKSSRSSSIQAARDLVHHGPPTQTFQYANLPPPAADRTWPAMPILTMEASFTGYAMRASNPFDYFSLVLLLLHAAVALAHMAWCCFRRGDRRFRTHDTWDSIPQLIALSQQSAPTPTGSTSAPLLKNVCGGVHSRKTAGVVAVVECLPHGVPNGDRGTEELQLRFQDGYRSREDANGPKPGESYGFRGMKGITAARLVRPRDQNQGMNERRA